MLVVLLDLLFLLRVEVRDDVLALGLVGGRLGVVAEDLLHVLDCLREFLLDFFGIGLHLFISEVLVHEDLTCLHPVLRRVGAHPLEYVLELG